MRTARSATARFQVWICGPWFLLLRRVVQRMAGRNTSFTSRQAARTPRFTGSRVCVALGVSVRFTGFSPRCVEFGAGAIIECAELAGGEVDAATCNGPVLYFVTGDRQRTGGNAA